MQRQRSGDAGVHVFVDSASPAQLPRGGVQRVDVGARVAEVHGASRARRLVADGQRGADPALRGERPVDAARLRIERVDGAVLAPDEQASTGDGRRRPGRRGVRKPERPLEREPRHVGGGQSGLVRRLIPRVGVRRRPACPRSNARSPRSLEPEAGSRLARSTSANRCPRDVAAERPAAQVLRNRAPLGAAQAASLRAHAAGGQRRHDGFRGPLPQEIGMGCARFGRAVVAARAVAGEDRRAIRCLRREGRAQADATPPEPAARTAEPG